jgi:hypothetical protein
MVVPALLTSDTDRKLVTSLDNGDGVGKVLAVSAVKVAVFRLELVDPRLSRHNRIVAIQLGSDPASTLSKPLVI